ncbi:MAG TPA: tRNA (adenosine(37)-N6)-dimethylallyltransferase MiaA [Chitinophagaceae bacterium]|nr:tRNA (adenosine(37)-N6)-dimethylallyltransferase MiaA [Chitinophagaceae bacterium]
MQKTVIIVAGPTAVGKTGIAIELAKHFNTEIISADSRQCYKELNIGVARPCLLELAEVKHHFIASHTIVEKVTAAVFENYALRKTQEIFQMKEVVVMVGGSGLYIKAFCDGMDYIPEIPQDIHLEIIQLYGQNGLPWLQSEIKKHDPVFFLKGEMQNPARMMRALEVIKTTGQSILNYRAKANLKRDFDVIKIGLELSKENLHQNISTRVDKMMAQGLLNEVRSLLKYQKLNALQTVGYKELFEYLNNKTSLKESVAAIKQNTRQYAKRQLTWFKKDREFMWMKPDATEVIKKTSGFL